DEERPESKGKIIAQILKEYSQPTRDNFAHPLLLAKGAIRERAQSAQQVEKLKSQIQKLQKDLSEKQGTEAVQLTNKIHSLQIELAKAEGELKAKQEEIERKDKTIKKAIAKSSNQTNTTNIQQIASPIKERKEGGDGSSQLGDIVLNIKVLEKEVISYRQGAKEENEKQEENQLLAAIQVVTDN
ncbi:1657_t:CDS:2, partial [Paraglomus occultum]